MKKKINPLLNITLVVLLATLGFSSCTTKEYYETYEDGAIIETHIFKVFKSPTALERWEWNTNKGRYECILDFGAVDDYIYEEGVIHSAVFVMEDGYETLKSLPYVYTRKDKVSGSIYTETISYDISPGNPYTIAFYIQSDDLKGNDDEQLKDYQFKVSLLWY